MAEKKKSYMAKKNEGNSLFFMIIHNILTDKSNDIYYNHVDDSTFDDVYTIVGIEKALSKCFDLDIVTALAECQIDFSKISDIRQHYYYLLHKLPRTYKSIDWKLNG